MKNYLINYIKKKMVVIYAENIPESIDDKIVHLEYDVDINKIRLPDEMEELKIDGKFIVNLQNLPKKIGKLILNMGQEEWEKSVLPDDIYELDIDGNKDCFLDKFPRRLRRLKVRNMGGIIIERLPMIEELELDRVKEINFDFLPCSLRRLSVRNWRENNVHNFVNLPNSIHELELDGIFYEYIPNTIKKVILKNIVADDDNVVQRVNRDVLEIVFNGVYMDCCVVIENVKELYLRNGARIREVIVDGVRYEGVVELKKKDGEIEIQTT